MHTIEWADSEDLISIDRIAINELPSNTQFVVGPPLKALFVLVIGLSLLPFTCCV
jgi:hypothetical protein